MAKRATKTVVRNIDGVTHIIQKPSRQDRFRRWLKQSKVPSVLAVIFLFAIVGVIIYAVRANDTEAANNQQVIASVGNHMVLPTNEQPVLATVTDRTALKTPFLREAQNGDKILFYQKAKRVIIYRSSIDKIVDVGPLEYDNVPKTSTQ